MSFQHTLFAPGYSVSMITIRRIAPVPNLAIAGTKRKRNQPLTALELVQGSKLGFDTHADISCLGRHARVMSVVDGSLCTVHAFNDSYSPLEGIQTVNGAFAVDSPEGELYILHVSNALDFTSTMDNSLLCTNQARYQGVLVDKRNVNGKSYLNRIMCYCIY